MTLSERVKKILAGSKEDKVVKEAKEVTNSLLENKITVTDVQQLLSHKNYIVTSFSNAAALTFLAITLFGTTDPWKLVVVFFVALLTTLQGFLASERMKMQILGKLVTLGTVSSDRVYAVTRAVSEALADGRLTPEEVAKIIQAIVSGKS